MRIRLILAALASGTAAYAIENEFHPAYPVSALVGTVVFAALLAAILAFRQPAPE